MAATFTPIGRRAGSQAASRRKCRVEGCDAAIEEGLYCRKCRDQILFMPDPAAVQQRAGQAGNGAQVIVVAVIVAIVTVFVMVPIACYVVACFKLWFGGIFGGN